MRALLVFVLFVGVQILSSLLAMLFTHYEAMGRGVSTENLTVTPVASGTSLLFCNLLLSAGLWLWFYRLAPRWQKLASGSTSATNEIEPSSFSPALRARQLLFAVLSVTLLSFGLSLLLQPLHLPDDGMQAQFEAMKGSVPCLLLLCFAGPLAEELVFRVGMARSFRLYGLPVLGAAALSALAFSLVHGNWSQAVPAFVLGIVLGIFYLRSGSLLLCLSAHIANNVFALVLLYRPDSLGFLETWPLWSILALGLLHVGLGLLNLRRVLRLTAPATESVHRL